MPRVVRRAAKIAGVSLRTYVHAGFFDFAGLDFVLCGLGDCFGGRACGGGFGGCFTAIKCFVAGLFGLLGLFGLFRHDVFQGSTLDPGRTPLTGRHPDGGEAWHVQFGEPVCHDEDGFAVVFGGQGGAVFYELVVGVVAFEGGAAGFAEAGGEAVEVAAGGGVAEFAEGFAAGGAVVEFACADEGGDGLGAFGAFDPYDVDLGGLFLWDDAVFCE